MWLGLEALVTLFAQCGPVNASPEGPNFSRGVRPQPGQAQCPSTSRMAESDMSKQFIIAVGIATAGRRDVLSRTITHLASQTRLPDTLVICPVKIGDVDTAILDAFPTRALAVTGAVGLPAQRNLILKATTDADIIVFFDDDFI